MAREQANDVDHLGASRILNLPQPVDDNEPARKVDVDSAIEGLAWKDEVVVAATANTSIASPGATVDGVTMVSLDRVLLRGQTSALENGVYVWNSAATPMTRSVDSDTAAKLEQAVISVGEGTDAGNSFRQTAVNFTLDTDDIVWASFSSGAAAASETTSGIAELATQTETDTGTDDVRIVTPLKLTNWSGAVKRTGADFGDGAATQYDVVHNFGSRDVQVEVYRVASPYDTILCDIERLDTNTVRLKFASGLAPTTNEFRVLVSY